MSLDPNREPKLHEMLNDPLVRLVMARDGLSPDQVRRVVEDASERLARRDADRRDAGRRDAA